MADWYTRADVPGHAPGCVALLEEHTGTRYSGDIVYDGGLIDGLIDDLVHAVR